MLRITVELVPSWGGPRKTIAVAEICNVGGDHETGVYDARFYGGEPFVDRDRFGPEDLVLTSKVYGHDRQHENVWRLVGKALKAFFAKGKR